jgi:hypothetical protein
MSYQTIKIIKGHPYLYEVHSERDGDKVRQVFDAYLGRADGGGRQFKQRVSKAQESPIERAIDRIEAKSTKEPEIIEPTTKEPEYTKAINSIKKRGISGDNLLDAQDLIKDLVEKGGQINPDGTITLYHRTTSENAKSIANSGSMIGKEAELFFGTKPTGQIEGYGDATVKVNLPIEKLELNDVFPNEAHVSLKTGVIGKPINVGKAELWEEPKEISSTPDKPIVEEPEKVISEPISKIEPKPIIEPITIPKMDERLTKIEYGDKEITLDIKGDYSDYQSLRDDRNKLEDGLYTAGDDYVYSVKSGKIENLPQYRSRYDYKNNKFIFTERPLPPTDISQIPIFHGSTHKGLTIDQLSTEKSGENFSGVGGNEFNGIYFTTRPSEAIGYATLSKTGGELIEGRISPNAKVIKYKDVGNRNQVDLLNDGVDVILKYEKGGDIGEVVVLNPKAILPPELEQPITILNKELPLILYRGVGEKQKKTPTYLTPDIDFAKSFSKNIEQYQLTGKEKIADFTIGNPSRTGRMKELGFTQEEIDKSNSRDGMKDVLKSKGFEIEKMLDTAEDGKLVETYVLLTPDKYKPVTIKDKPEIIKPEDKPVIEKEIPKEKQPDTIRVYKGWVPYDYRTNKPIERIQRPSEFPAFNKDEQGVNVAGFFTTNTDVADNFAKGISKEGVVGTFDIKLGRVFEIDAEGKKAGETQFELQGKPFRDAVRSGNFDTIVIKNTSDEGDVYVSLNPDNIKIVNSSKIINDTPDLQKQIPTMQEVIAEYKPIGSSAKTIEEPILDIGGFEQTLSSPVKAKAIPQMNEKRMIAGKPQSRKEYIENAIANGATVEIREGKKAIVKPDGTYMRQGEITKTAIDYAEYLLNKSNPNLQQPTTKKVKQQPHELAPIPESSLSEMVTEGNMGRAATVYQNIGDIVSNESNFTEKGSLKPAPRTQLITDVVDALDKKILDSSEANSILDEYINHPLIAQGRVEDFIAYWKGRPNTPLESKPESQMTTDEIQSFFTRKTIEPITKLDNLPNIAPNMPLSYVQAKKRADGKWQLFFTGTRNEVFPNELFDSQSDAKMAFKVAKAKLVPETKTTSEVVKPMVKPESLPKPIEKQLPKLIPMEDNYLKPISVYTPNIYRETNIDGLAELSPNVFGYLEGKDLFVSNTPNLALGQGENKGVLIKFKSEGLQGQVNTNKPSWKFAYDNGEAEFIVKRTQEGVLKNNIESITISPKAKGNKLKRIQANNWLKNWNKTVNDDGSTTYTPPA